MKKITFLCLAILIFPKLHSQQLTHPVKSHKASNGKIYWNKTVPVYVRISSSPEDKGILLENDEQAKYANPIYFDTEGINYIRTRNAVDNKTLKLAKPIQEVMLPVYADGEAPISKANYLNTPKRKKDNVTYFGKGLLIELKSADAVSGVENIFYSLDHKPYTKYIDKIPMDKPGKILLKYYAVDFVGNVESENETQLITDHAAPTSTLSSKGPQIDNSFSLGSTFFITAKDSLSGVQSIYYKFDDSPYQLYEGNPINADHLTDGYHKLTYYSIDKVKNIEEEKSYELFFDKSAPLMAADILGDKFMVDDQIYFSGRTKLKFIAVDNRVGVKQIKYSINNEEYKIYEAPFYLPNATGNHIIRYYALDNFGNKTNDDRTSTDFHQYEHLVTKIYVDLTGPNLSYDFEGNLLETRDTVFMNSSTKLILSAVDTESGLKKITYSLEGSAEELNYTTPISFNKSGYHVIDFYGYDNVSNRNISHMNIYVDNIGPKVFYYFSSEPYETMENGRKTYSSRTNIYLAATDDHVGLRNIYYTINGGKEQQYNTQIDNLKRKNEYIIGIRAVDQLGNETKTKVIFNTAQN